MCFLLKLHADLLESEGTSTLQQDGLVAELIKRAMLQEVGHIVEEAAPFFELTRLTADGRADADQFSDPFLLNQM